MAGLATATTNYVPQVAIWGSWLTADSSCLVLPFALAWATKRIATLYWLLRRGDLGMNPSVPLFARHSASIFPIKKSKADTTKARTSSCWGLAYNLQYGEDGRSL